MELTLNVPVNIYSYFFSGVMNNRTELFLSPSLAARYRFTPRMSLTLRGSARRSPASLHDIHTSSILTDYRSFSSGVDDYYTSSGQSLSATFNYRNAPSGIFIMALGSYGGISQNSELCRNSSMIMFSTPINPCHQIHAMPWHILM